MTTPIATFEDILAAMEQNPQLQAAMRAHVLAQELLTLPARFVELQEQVNRLQATVDGLVGDVAELKENVGGLSERVDGLAENVGTLTGRVDSIVENVDTLTGRVDGLTDNVGTLTGRVDGLTDNVATLTGRMDSLTSRVDTMSGTVSRLAGEDYETHVCNYAERFLRRQLGISATVWATQRDNQSLTSLLNAAEIAGRLSAAEVDELDEADLVLVSDTSDGHVLVEISITIQQSDVDRAITRAALLAKATGRDAVAIVAGSAEEDGLELREAHALIAPERPVPLPS